MNADPLQKGQATHSSILGLLLWLSWQRICLQYGKPGFNPWTGKIPGEGKGYPLQYSGLQNSTDCIAQGVAKSWTRLRDFLECEVKWALESITMNKASGGEGIPVELFHILKDDAVKVLHSICQQIWKTQQWP